jgi:hypothetical protein
MCRLDTWLMDNSIKQILDILFIPSINHSSTFYQVNRRFLASKPVTYKIIFFEYILSKTEIKIYYQEKNVEINVYMH